MSSIWYIFAFIAYDVFNIQSCKETLKKQSSVDCIILILHWIQISFPLTAIRYTLYAYKFLIMTLSILQHHLTSEYSFYNSRSIHEISIILRHRNVENYNNVIACSIVLNFGSCNADFYYRNLCLWHHYQSWKNPEKLRFTILCCQPIMVNITKNLSQFFMSFLYGQWSAMKSVSVLCCYTQHV